MRVLYFKPSWYEAVRRYHHLTGSLLLFYLSFGFSLLSALRAALRTELNIMIPEPYAVQKK